MPADLRDMAMTSFLAATASEHNSDDAEGRGEDTSVPVDETADDTVATDTLEVFESTQTGSSARACAPGPHTSEATQEAPGDDVSLGKPEPFRRTSSC